MDWDIIKTSIKVIIITFFIVAILTTLITLAIIPLYYTSCSATANEMKVAWQYNWKTGCMIDINGQWVPLSSYRVIDGDN